MRGFRFLLLFFILGCWSFQSFATKRALIIAVGTYDEGTKWAPISSENDVPLIKNALLRQNFKEENIRILLSNEADKEGILSAFRELYEKTNPGDIVVVHYSGHGQQVEDFIGDEADGLDEAIVPRNALAFYSEEKNYHGQDHIIDDELEVIIQNLRNRLGKNGQLLWVMDSCHSGSMTRGGKARGGHGALVSPEWKAPKNTEITRGSGFFLTSRLSEEASPFVMISGAAANELNYEYVHEGEGVGSLSYAFSKAMNDLATIEKQTYRQLFASIAATMKGIAPKQNPVIEGDVDYVVFKGEYVEQAAYFEVNSIRRNNDILFINGGQINSIFKETTVFVLPSGSTEITEDKIITKGIVTNSKFGEAVVRLKKALPDKNEKNYWVFIDQPSYGDISIRVFFDESVKDEGIKKGVVEFLKKNRLGTVVDMSGTTDLMVYEKDGNYQLAFNGEEDSLENEYATRGNSGLEELNTKIFNFAQGNYLKKLSIKNPGFEFEFRLVPIDYDKEKGVVKDTLPARYFYGESGVFEVKPDRDFVLLEVTNKSQRDLYISIVEINTAGEIASFFPNQGCTLGDQDRKLAPGRTLLFRSCVFSFGPPYERLVLKGFASDRPLNFQSTVTTRGLKDESNNPLSRFLRGTYSHSRGSSGNAASEKLQGYSAEFVYEIVR